MTEDDITDLLGEWSTGEADALKRVIPLVAGELRRLARFHLNREGRNHTLQPTALVNELYLRLSTQHRVRFVNRTQFFSLASRLMRRVLVDHYRARQSVKRGEGQATLSLDETLGIVPGKTLDLLALDEALDRLKEIDARMSRIVELRFFTGLTVHETAQALDISEASVKRDWSGAKAYLSRELRPRGR